VETPGVSLPVWGWGMVIVGIVMLLAAVSTIPRKVQVSRRARLNVSP